MSRKVLTILLGNGQHLQLVVCCHVRRTSFCLSSKQTVRLIGYFIAIHKMNLLISDRIIEFSCPDFQQADMISEDISYLIKIMTTAGVVTNQRVSEGHITQGGCYRGD